MKVALLFIASLPLLTQAAPVIKLPDLPPTVLSEVGQLSFKHIDESSGLVQSKLWPEVLWTHNDSGDKARIYAIDLVGDIIKPKKAKKDFKGIKIPDTVNIDWEDITTDDNGNLIIAACGNNENARRDLALYLIREPNPYLIEESRSLQIYPFEWPDQKEFPALVRNFDCEAVFFAMGKIHLLTKHEKDGFTKLYRFDSLEPNKLNTPILIDTFDIRGKVTGADYSQTLSLLAILTYNGVWTFDVNGSSDDFFNGQIAWLPLDRSITNKVEGICIVDNDLYISNEQRSLYKLPLDQLITVRTPAE